MYNQKAYELELEDHREMIPACCFKTSNNIWFTIFEDGSAVCYFNT